MPTLFRGPSPVLVFLALLAACSDDVVAGSATVDLTTTTTDTGTTATPTTEAPTTTAPTTTDSDGGSDSDSDSTTGTATTDDTTTSTSTTTTGDTTASSTTSTPDDTTTTSTGVTVECGNGVVEDGEVCDDGNLDNRDGCSDACVSEQCGDGVVQAGLGETCDDGNSDLEDGCSDACLLETCGDSVVQPGLGETCDDGNADPGDGCSDACLLETCGDGILQELGEACDDGNTESEDGCSAACELEVCGDGVLQPGLGEACDDGNVVGNDGCSADCQLDAISLCSPGTVSLLVNEGFESGAFAPWTSNGVATVTTNPHSGIWAAETGDNFYVQQTFAATPVTQLASADFWTWHDMADAPAMYVEWGYADNSIGSTFYGSDELDGWTHHDILPVLDPAKSLTRLTVWGYFGGQPLPDITRFDDFRLCKNL